MSDAVHLFIIGTLATAVIGAYGFCWKLHSHMHDNLDKEISKIKAANEEAVGACHGRITREIQRLEQNYYEYKLHVANSFASLAHLQESERRTAESLKSINDKLDRLIEGRLK